MTAPGPVGPQREARPFDEIARAILRRKRLAEKGKHSALVDAWQRLVGEGVAAHTRIGSFKGGTLVVEVDSPALLHELNGFMRENLLRSLRETKAGRDVAQMQLRLGTLRATPDAT